MELGKYADGRDLSYDEASGKFAVGDAEVTTDQVLGYDAAGQITWASDELRDWARGLGASDEGAVGHASAGSNSTASSDPEGGWFTRLPLWGKVLFVLFYPVSVPYGLWVMWKDERFSHPVRIVLSIVGSLFMLWFVFSVATADPSTPGETGESPKPAATQEQDAEPAPEAEEPVVEQPQAEEPVPDEPTPQAEPSSDLAKRTEDGVLEAFGVDSFTELLGAGGMEDSLVPYISGFEVVGGDTVKVTVQLTRDSVTEEELERTAFVIHSLTGEKVEDLNRVEVWTADGELYGVSNRRDVPLLNL